MKLQINFFMGQTGLVDNPNAVAEPFDGLVFCINEPLPLNPPLLTRLSAGEGD
jgi:hypothetical protein